jgi:limonene 1,2-monooxygenase
MGAVGARVARHIEQTGEASISPEILAAMGLGKKAEAAE